MEAIIRSIKETTHNKKAGGTFKTIDILCDVMVDNKSKEVRQLTYSKGTESVVKYLKYCKVTDWNSLINSYVDVTIAKRMYTDEKGVNKTYTFIKYLNLLDGHNKPIIMKSEQSSNVLPEL